jgi:hypothetical protein
MGVPVSRRRHRLTLPGLAGSLILLAFRVVWLALLGLLLAGRVLLIYAVPRKTRSKYRQQHGREGARSADISSRLRRRVLAADRHLCVARNLDGCSGRFEIDHGIPWIAGGITWIFNLFTLCSFHNQTKSNYSRDQDGFVHYRRSRWGGADDPALAAQIRAAERRAGRNPVRWLLALIVA